MVLVSPWVKRGYVTKTHSDVSSIHRLITHIFGIPFANAIVETASVPFDAFTSTPDFTPYSYTTRTVPLSCGPAASHPESRLTESWDMSDVDNQPGLAEQVERVLRGHPLSKLTPELEGEVYLRMLSKMSGTRRQAERDDDD